MYFRLCGVARSWYRVGWHRIFRTIEQQDKVALLFVVLFLRGLHLG
jgi:hypothetical protein